MSAAEVAVAPVVEEKENVKRGGGGGGRSSAKRRRRDDGGADVDLLGGGGEESVLLKKNTVARFARVRLTKAGLDMNLGEGAVRALMAATQKDVEEEFRYVGRLSECFGQDTFSSKAYDTHRYLSHNEIPPTKHVVLKEKEDVERERRFGRVLNLLSKKSKRESTSSTSTTTEEEKKKKKTKTSE